MAISIHKVDSTTPAGQSFLTPSTSNEITIFPKDNGPFPPTLFVAKNVGGNYVEVPLETSVVYFSNYGVAGSWNLPTNTYTLGPVSGISTPIVLGGAQAGFQLIVKFSKSPNAKYEGSQNLKLKWGSNTYNISYESTTSYVYDVEHNQVLYLIWDGGVFQAISAKPNVAINTNYVTVKTLRNSSSLIPGALYRISDYETTFLNESGLPVVDNANFFNSAFEPLVVMATSENKLSHIAYSEQFPNDEIHYELDAPVWAPSAKGQIVYRRDSKLNVETQYDFRGVLFPRYSIDSYTSTKIDEISYSSSFALPWSGDLQVLPSQSGYTIPSGDTGSSIVLDAASQNSLLVPTFPLNADKTFDCIVQNVSIINPSFISEITSEKPSYQSVYANVVFLGSSVIKDVYGEIAATTFVSDQVSDISVTSYMYGSVFLGNVSNLLVSKPVKFCVFGENCNKLSINQHLEKCVFAEQSIGISLFGNSSKFQRFINFETGIGFSEKTFIEGQCSTFEQPYQLSLSSPITNRGLIQDPELYIRSDMKYVGTWKVYSDAPTLTGKYVMDKVLVNVDTANQPNLSHTIKIIFVEGPNNVSTRVDSELDVPNSNDVGVLCLTTSTISFNPNDRDYLELHKQYRTMSQYIWNQVGGASYPSPVISTTIPSIPSVTFNISTFNNDIVTSIGSTETISFLIDRNGCTDTITAYPIILPPGFSFNGGNPITITSSQSLISGDLTISAPANGIYNIPFQFTGCSITRNATLTITVA